MVDDLFLSTGVFAYDGNTNEGPEERLSGSEIAAFASFESSLNSKYGSSIVTEWPFNGLGILEKVKLKYKKGVIERLRPVTMETRCFHKKLEFHRYSPKDFCTARYGHKSSKKKFQTFQKPRKK